MSATAGSSTGLVVDPTLQRAWSGAVAGTVNGIAGAVAGSHGSVVVVSPAPVDDTTIATLAPNLASALGVRSVDVIVVTTTTLPELIRNWIYQAGQGSGRGVRVTVRAGNITAPSTKPGTGKDGRARQAAGANVGPGPSGNAVAAKLPVRVLVRAIDSSARELASRLASPQEPALPALRALLGGREVSVEDEETLPIT